jgi:WD40 repeat protein
VAQPVAGESFLPTVDPGLYVRADEIARGGMGRIVAARDKRLGRPVAIKELLAKTPDRLRRFEREAFITARLQHPAIVSIHEAGRWPSGEPFFAMKLVAGRSLDQMIAARRSLKDRMALLPHAIAVADALAYAHSLRIIHRDLKPSNVLCGDYGETVVVDWGLAKDLAASGDSADTPAEPAAAPTQSHPDGLRTEAGAVLGTPAYMPPEQWQGRPVDERADVYSLGALLYHLLSGAPPQRSLSGQLPAPTTSVAEGVPGDLQAIVDKAMSVDPLARYPTARELAEDLKRFQTGALVGARQYSRGDLVARWIRRHLVGLGIGAGLTVFTLVVLVVAGYRIYASNEATQAAGQVAEEARKEAADENQRLVLDQARQAVDDDPTAAVAWLEHLEALGREGGVLAATALSQGVARAVVRDDIGDVAYSSDGRTLYESGRVGVLAIDVKTGVVRQLPVHRQARDPIGLFAYRNQELLAEIDDIQPASAPVDAAGMSLRQIVLTDVVSGQVFTRIELPFNGEDYPLEASPDGSRVLNPDTSSLITVWDLEEGRAVSLPPLPSQPDYLSMSTDGQVIAVADVANVIRVYDPASQAWRTLPSVGEVSSIQLSPDGRSLAVTSSNDAVSVLGWDPPRRVDLTAAAIAPPRFDASGSLYYPNGDNVTTWDAANGESQLSFAMPTPGPWQSHRWEVAADGSFGALSDGPTVTVQWFDSNEAHVLRGHASAVESIQLAPDGASLASEGRDGLRLWTRPAPTYQALANISPGILTASLSPDGRSLAVVPAEDSTPLTLVGVPDGVPRSVEGLTGGGVIAFSPDGSILVQGQDPDAIQWVNVAAADIYRSTTLIGADEMDAVAFSPDGRLLAASGGNETLAVWDVASGKPHFAWNASADGIAIRALAFSPDGQRLAVSHESGALELVDAFTGQRLRSLRDPDDTAPIEHLAFSADGSQLLTVPPQDSPLVLSVYDCTTGQRRDLPISEITCNALAMSRDRTMLAIADSNLNLRLFDARSLEPVGVIQGTQGGAALLAFSPDGTQLAAGTEQGEVFLWDRSAQAGRIVTVFDSSQVNGLGFRPDGTIVATSADGDVRVLTDDLPTDENALRATLQAATSATISSTSPLESPVQK